MISLLAQASVSDDGADWFTAIIAYGLPAIGLVVAIVLGTILYVRACVKLKRMSGAGEIDWASQLTLKNDTPETKT